MANIPVEAIRQSHRYEMTLNRKKLKHEENDLRRSLAVMRLSEVDLSKLANKLKTKSEVSVADLQLLKNILIQDEKNIKLVLNTQGALRGLVRELSGSDVSRQVEAAGCLCNLALADLRGCITIIKGAGAYLVAALDSQNLQLAMTCAWTLGNLSGSGLPAGRLLAATGAISKLCAQVEGDHERMDAAVYALTLFAHAMVDELSAEHMALMVKSVGGSECGSAFRLYYILSCHRGFEDPDNLIQHQIIQRFPDMMNQHHRSCTEAGCCGVLPAVRALANMARGASRRLFLQHIHSRPRWRRDFAGLIKDPRLKSSMLWLYGNMVWRRDPEYFIKTFDFSAHRPPTPEPDLLPDQLADQSADLLPLGEGFDQFMGEEPAVPTLNPPLE